MTGRFYLHKEAQNAQNAQTIVNFQKNFWRFYLHKDHSFCTKKILFAQREFYLHKEILEGWNLRILFAQRDGS